MRNQQVQNNRLKCLGMWRDRFRIDRRYDYARIRYLGRIAAIPSNHAHNLGANCLGILQPRHQVRTDVLFKVAAANGKDKYRIFGGEFARF